MKKSGSSTPLVVLLVFLAVIIVLRLTVVTGEKYLKGVHPWDYIAMILSTAIVLVLIYIYRKKLT